MEFFDDYEIIALEGSDAFQFRHKSGDALLTTQRVSLSTLVRLALEDEILLALEDEIVPDAQE